MNWWNIYLINVFFICISFRVYTYKKVYCHQYNPLSAQISCEIWSPTMLMTCTHTHTYRGKLLWNIARYWQFLFLVHCITIATALRRRPRENVAALSNQKWGARWGGKKSETLLQYISVKKIRKIGSAVRFLKRWFHNLIKDLRFCLIY